LSRKELAIEGSLEEKISNLTFSTTFAREIMVYHWANRRHTIFAAYGQMDGSNGTKEQSGSTGSDSRNSLFHSNRDISLHSLHHL
jgi:hypothetical protein